MEQNTQAVQETKKVKPARPLCSEGDEFVSSETPLTTINQNQFGSFNCKCGKVFKRLIARKVDGLIYLPEHALTPPKVIKTKPVEEEVEEVKEEVTPEPIVEEKKPVARKRAPRVRKPKVEENTEA